MSQQSFRTKQCACGTTIFWRDDLNPPIFTESVTSEDKHTCSAWKPGQSSGRSYGNKGYNSGYKSGGYSARKSNVDFEARDKKKSEDIERLSKARLDSEEANREALDRQTAALNRLADVIEQKGLGNG